MNWAEFVDRFITRIETYNTRAGQFTPAVRQGDQAAVAKQRELFAALAALDLTLLDLQQVDLWAPCEHKVGDRVRIYNAGWPDHGLVCTVSEVASDQGQMFGVRLSDKGKDWGWINGEKLLPWPALGEDQA